MFYLCGLSETSQNLCNKHIHYMLHLFFCFLYSVITSMDDQVSTVWNMYFTQTEQYTSAPKLFLVQFPVHIAVPINIGFGIIPFYDIVWRIIS
jgi:hypothetical protein